MPSSVKGDRAQMGSKDDGTHASMRDETLRGTFAMELA
jgi:hypothetical protein